MNIAEYFSGAGFGTDCYVRITIFRYVPLETLWTNALLDELISDTAAPLTSAWNLAYRAQYHVLYDITLPLMSGGVSRVSLHREIPLNFYTEFKNGSTNVRSNQTVLLIQTNSGPLTPITVGFTIQSEFDDF